MKILEIFLSSLLLMILSGCAAKINSIKSLDSKSKTISIISRETVSWKNEIVAVNTCSALSSFKSTKDIKKDLLNNARTIAVEAVEIELSSAFSNEQTCKASSINGESCDSFVLSRVKTFSKAMLKKSSYKFTMHENDLICIAHSSSYESSSFDLNTIPNVAVTTKKIFDTSITNTSILVELSFQEFKLGDLDKAIFYLNRAAELGNSNAQANLGVFYFEGIAGLEKNYDKGLFWLRKAIAQNNAHAQWALGHKYYHGISVQKDVDTSIEWFTKASKQGHNVAQGMLGLIYSTKGSYYDIGKAIYWLGKSAENGNSNSQMKLSLIYSNIIEVKNLNKAKYWAMKAANNGNLIAMKQLGFMYLKGIGTSKDNVKAFYWLEFAAQKDEVYSQRQIAKMYKNGQGVEASKSKSIYWYTKAALLSDTYSQAYLGVLYTYGNDNTKEDKWKAVHWLQKAALKNDKVSEYLLGTFYYHSLGGLSQDFTKAFELFKKSAEQGYREAQYNLGLMYSRGEGVEKSEEKANHWYGLAGLQQHPGADYLLGKKLLQSSIKENQYKGLIAIRRSADNGNEDAQYLTGFSFCVGSGWSKNLKLCKHYLNMAKDNGVNVENFWNKYELWKY